MRPARSAAPAPPGRSFRWPATGAGTRPRPPPGGDRVGREPAGERLNLSSSDAVAAQLDRVEGRGAGDIAGVLLRMVPPNIVQAAAEGQMLGLIFFSLLCILTFVEGGLLGLYFRLWINKKVFP